MARPSDLRTEEEEAVEMGVLPQVPGGDWDPDLEVRSGRGRSSSRAMEDRPRSSQGTSVERKRPLKFTTPASWNGSTGSGKGRAVKEGLRTEGRMPVDEGDHQQGAEGLLREEAKKIAKRASESTSGRTQDDLERAMEKEVFTQLQDENMRLREELTKMQHLKVESGQQSGCLECLVLPEGKESRHKRIPLFAAFGLGHRVLSIAFFFWTMLRASLELWQSLSCASIVIVGQQDQKERSGTKNNKATKPKQSPKPTPKNQTNNPSLANRVKGETRWNKFRLSPQTTIPGSHNVFSRK